MPRIGTKPRKTVERSVKISHLLDIPSNSSIDESIKKLNEIVLENLRANVWAPDAYLLQKPIYFEHFDPTLIPYKMVNLRLKNIGILWLISILSALGILPNNTFFFSYFSIFYMLSLISCSFYIFGNHKCILWTFHEITINFCS